MLGPFIRWIQSRGIPWTRAPVPTATPPREEVLATSPGPAADDVPMPVEEQDPSSLHTEKVWDRMHRSVAQLNERFPADMAPSDTTALIDSLTQPGGYIRQPPLAARAVLALCRRPNYGLEEIVTLMEKDPAMSQALLTCANSAWYAGLSTHPVLSLKSAIHRVGNQGIHATVMHQMIEGILSRPGPGLDGLVRQVWEHMVRTAPIAREIAGFFGADPEEAFTLALLHDVGKLVLFDRVAAERKRLRRELRFPAGFVDVALQLLHEPLGGLAALEWGLDGRSAAVISSHHRRGDHPHSEPLSEVLFVAEAVDIALHRHCEVDLNRIWEDGHLTGPIDKVSAWLVRHANE